MTLVWTILRLKMSVKALIKFDLISFFSFFYNWSRDLSGEFMGIISLEIIVFGKMAISLFILCLKMSVKALTKLDLVSSYDFFYSAKILIHSLLFSPNDPGSK